MPHTQAQAGRPASLLERVDRWPLVHRIIRVTRAREAVRAILSRFPIRRTLAESGIKYRIRALEGFLLADEICKRGIYDPAIRSRDVRTFIDLGCNAGFFICRLAHLTGRRDLEGLAIDANEETLRETAWHLRENGLAGVRTEMGLAGAIDPEGDSADFYVCPSDMGSSQFPDSAPGLESKGEWRKLRVPRIDVGSVWRRHFGEKRVDLLKIDIEGSEQAFLEQESAFLESVDAVVLELHEWLVDRRRVDEVLTAAGFSEPRLLVQEPITQILYYTRS